MVGIVYWLNKFMSVYKKLDQKSKGGYDIDLYIPVFYFLVVD